jgi:NhaA family Na+:H+ antiporter
MTKQKDAHGSAQLPSSPPEAWLPLVEFMRSATRPLERFMRIEAASGIALIVAALIALVWANSPWSGSYTALWHTTLGIRLGAFEFERSLEWFVNDVLMVVFFFVVGLEIRREIYCGELSEWRRASIPAVAALGGMLVPAALYLAIAGAPDTRHGWGVPMATDIAFAVGILALLGRRVPAALRVLLLALAVIDDLGAILVIAIFYSSGIAPIGLLVAAGGFLGIVALQRLGVRSKLAYVPPAVVAWAGVYAAGIHPTIAGVIVGLMTPVRAWLGAEGFSSGVRLELDRLVQDGHEKASHAALGETLRYVNAARREAISPAEGLIESLHGWVAFGIMPIFALANAGVVIEAGALDTASWHVIAGIVVGLVVGKPIGVIAACWLTIRLRIGTLPAGITRQHLAVLGVVAGVGFTMSLFVAQLAFTSPQLLAAAKLGVLVASACAAIIGISLGRFLPVVPSTADVALTVDEAERSTDA